MTQRTNSAHKSVNLFWQRSLFIKGISWIGCLGVLSQSVLLHQRPAYSEPVVAGAEKTSQEALAGIPPQVHIAVEPSAPLTSETYLRPATAQPEWSAPGNPSAATSEDTSKSYKSGNQGVVDYNNAYIDPTDYSVGATNKSESPGYYEPPTAVVLDERSTGCQTVYGQGVSSSCDYAPAPVPTEAAPWTPPPPPPPTEVAQQQEQPASGGYVAAQETRATPDTYSQTTTVTPEPVSSQAEAIETAQVSAPSQDTSFFSGAIPVPPQMVPIPENGGTGMQPVNIGPFMVGANGVGVGNKTLKSGYYYNPGVKPSGLPGNGNISLLFPLSIPAPITSIFGWRVHPISGDRQFHSGTDLGAPLGTPVLAAYAGQVAIADWLGGYGLAVVISHNQGTQETLYGHLSEIFVKPGEKVEQGTVIGRVGSTGNSTGPHLHFELRQMTAEGWVNLDPGAQLEYAMAQLIQGLQTARSTSDVKASAPQINQKLSNKPGLVSPQKVKIKQPAASSPAVVPSGPTLIPSLPTIEVPNSIPLLPNTQPELIAPNANQKPSESSANLPDVKKVR